jgi:hypothetical protein
LVDVKAIGAKGGRAKAKGKAGSFRDAIRRRLEGDPDGYAAKLLGSGAKGIELGPRSREASKSCTRRPASASASFRSRAVRADSTPYSGNSLRRDVASAAKQCRAV